MPEIQAEIKEMFDAHELLAEFHYKPQKLEHGYANRSLKIDLSNNKIELLPVTEEMKKLWVGGKGFGLWYMFQEINKDTKWDSPQNPIVFSPGPLSGTTSFPGAGKTIVTAISPMTHGIMDSNVGGYFGPYLKFSGFDALEIIGKASEEVIVYIDAVNYKVTIEKAPKESIDSHILAEELTFMYADDELDRRNIAVVSAGRGADHTNMGVLNFSFWDWRRDLPRLKQAGRGGIGTVFRNKKVKAIVAKNRQVDPSWLVEESKVAHKTRPSEDTTTISGEEITAIHEIIKKWNTDPEYAIEMMQDIQEKFYHVSEAAINILVKEIKTPKAQLYHIATFYSSLSLDKKGATTIQICKGTACHVKGSGKLLERFEQLLGIKEGETTKDKKYTLEAVACLGACSIAPVVKIGDKVIGNVQVKDCEKLLKEYNEKGGNE